MNFKGWVLLLMAIVFVYQVILDVVRVRSASRPVPANVADLYDAETYRKWRAYHGEKCRLAIFGHVITFAAEALLIVFDAYAAFARFFPQGPFMQLFAVLLLSTLAGLVSLPLEWYDTMVIEEKYGFNRSGVKTFVSDQIKKLLIGILLTTLIGAVLMAVHRWLGDYIIIAFAAVLSAIILVASFLMPFLTKVFNKFTPLEDGELKQKLTALLEKHGYHVRAINVMDASKRSTKSNAYFAGFGKTKTIVLYDTILQQMTTEEICAVFAHEMGHGLHRDTLKHQLISFIQTLILAVLAWLTLRTPGLFTDLGFSGVNYGMALILLTSVEFALISPLFGVVASYLSRRAEYQADAVAVSEGYGEALISGLRKLSVENFANLSPAPLLVALEYSHPPLSERIAAIEKAMA